MAIFVFVELEEVSSQIRAVPEVTVPVEAGVAVETHSRGAVEEEVVAPSVVLPNVATP
jgi:hypothetical protein